MIRYHSLIRPEVLKDTLTRTGDSGAVVLLDRKGFDVAVNETGRDHPVFETAIPLMAPFVRGTGAIDKMIGNGTTLPIRIITEIGGGTKAITVGGRRRAAEIENWSGEHGRIGGLTDQRHIGGRGNGSQTCAVSSRADKRKTIIRKDA